MNSKLPMNRQIIKTDRESALLFRITTITHVIITLTKKSITMFFFVFKWNPFLFSNVLACVCYGFLWCFNILTVECTTVVRVMTLKWHGRHGHLNTRQTSVGFNFHNSTSSAKQQCETERCNVPAHPYYIIAFKVKWNEIHVTMKITKTAIISPFISCTDMK